MKKMLILICLIGLAIPTLASADVMADYEANCIKCHSLDAKTNVRWAPEAENRSPKNLFAQ